MDLDLSDTPDAWDEEEEYTSNECECAEVPCCEMDCPCTRCH